MLFLLACTCSEPDPPVVETGRVEEGFYSGEWSMPEREALSELPLPEDEAGNYRLVEGPLASLLIDVDDRQPISAAAECGAVVLACYDPEQRDWLGCLENVPVCETDTPWEGNAPMCCAAECPDRYRALRSDGMSPVDAMVGAILDLPGSCMPGLESYMDGGQL